MPVANGKMKRERAILGPGFGRLRVEVGNLFENATIRNRQYNVLVHPILVALVPARSPSGSSGIAIAVLGFCLVFGRSISCLLGIVDATLLVCACQIAALSTVLADKVRIRQATVAGGTPVAIVDAVLGMTGGNVKHDATGASATTTIALVNDSTRIGIIHAHGDQLGMIP